MRSTSLLQLRCLWIEKLWRGRILIVWLGKRWFLCNVFIEGYTQQSWTEKPEALSQSQSAMSVAGAVYMANFSSGRNSKPTPWLCDYMTRFSTGFYIAAILFSWINHHSKADASVKAEISLQLHEVFQPFKPGRNFQLQSGLWDRAGNLSPGWNFRTPSRPSLQETIY